MSARSESGFTLIEVMIAIIMLTVGVLALSTSSGAVTKMMYSGRMRTDAAMIAQSVMDSLRARVFATTASQCNLLTSATLSPPQRGYTATVDVGGTGNKRSVIVTVRYRLGTDAQLKTEIVNSSFFCN
jgi:type IV pilus modification protein PilV